jgi:hypothetical protein
VSPTALLFEQATQYKISKIKLSISTIAVTPANERLANMYRGLDFAFRFGLFR